MGADKLDAQLEGVALFLLIVIALIIVATLTSYILFKFVQRRKDKAHNKLSASRRGEDSGINLFEKAERERTGGRSRSGSGKGKNSQNSFDFLRWLKDLAYKLDLSRRGSRGRRSKGRRRRSSSSSGNLRIDLMKKPPADTGAHAEDAAP